MAVNEVAYTAGEIVLYPGEASSLFRLRTGLVRLHAVDRAGYGVTLRYVKPRGFYGEEALTGHKRRYFAEAVTDSTVEAVNVDDLGREELTELATALARNLDHMNGSLLRLAGKPLRSRIAAELLDLADSALAGRTDSGLSVVYLTHDDLAAAVGSVRETVTKVIGELSRLGALRAGYGKVVLLDRGALAEIAGT